MKTSKNLIKAYYSKTTKNITRLVIVCKNGKISMNVKDLKAESLIDIFPILNKIYTDYIYNNIDLKFIQDNRSK